jgi:hypothetical protein
MKELEGSDFEQRVAMARQAFIKLAYKRERFEVPKKMKTIV